MILKSNWLLYGILLACLPSVLSANITTLQSWDPAPIFNAANLNMPPDSPFCSNLKNRILNDSSDKVRRWGINISPFVQKATRAQQAENVFFGDSPLNSASTALGLPQPGTPGGQLSDYQGTPYLMGLFLGQDSNGNSIWGGPTAPDSGVTTDITTATVGATQLAQNLQIAVNELNDNADATLTPTPGPNALLYNIGTNPSATPPNTAPSILSQSILKEDTIYFGAFSVPLAYQKTGFRWEFNFDFSDNVGFLARGGFCNITQRAGASIGLSPFGPSTAVAAGANASNANISLYTGLNTVENANLSGAQTFPIPEAQNIFNEWLTNNINQLLDPINGADYNIETFSGLGVEDIQVLGFFRNPFILHPVNEKKHAPVILTPYAIVGGSIPLAPVRDYSKLYALPFGNNSHTSVGGVVGITVDFINSIEFGVEFGATGFLQKVIRQLPVPNHMLQRIIYPYRQDVNYSPGFNGQFSAIFNAYKFTHNTSFSLRYTYVQHTQDSIQLVTPSPYFFPNLLEDKSVWNSQMLIGALTFELQPSAYLSIAWQGALTQKNAYCSNMILMSLNFLF